MTSTIISPSRIVSGMRPTGKMHLGHYHGVIKNWLKLQHQYDCYLFAADLHALTTHYDAPQELADNTREMVIDWLACGVDPNKAHIFVQSQIPEVSELQLLLSMITPLSWLERVPTYKDQQAKIKDKDLSNFGFLGYPVLMSADILLLKSSLVPVGEDQVPHMELVREIARRFNYIYGREPNFEQLVDQAIHRLSKKNQQIYRDLLKAYQEQGKEEALDSAGVILSTDGHLSKDDQERLTGYLEGSGRMILPEPEAMLTEFPVLPGLDGRKMSKSYHNTIGLREEPAEVEKKIKTMPTDPARIRRTDPGDPDKCPVWALHKVYSNDDVKEWVQQGCRSAGIGCIECKKPLAECVIKEQAPIREQAIEFMSRPKEVQEIIEEGNQAARKIARQTMEEVRETMGLTTE